MLVYMLNNIRPGPICTARSSSGDGLLVRGSVPLSSGSLYGTSARDGISEVFDGDAALRRTRSNT